MLLINGQEIRTNKDNLLKIIIGIFLILIIFDSITAAHDMMVINRTRWLALNELNNELKRDPKQIDGGFEYNAWHFYRWDFPKTKTKNWWWVYDDEYVVSLGKLPKYEVLREYDYTRWFPPGFKGKIFVSKRN